VNITVVILPAFHSGNISRFSFISNAFKMTLFV